jgi:hypothetical protein
MKGFSRDRSLAKRKSDIRAAAAHISGALGSGAAGQNGQPYRDQVMLWVPVQLKGPRRAIRLWHCSLLWLANAGTANALRCILGSFSNYAL